MGVCVVVRAWEREIGSRRGRSEHFHCRDERAALTMGTVEPISLEEEQRGRHSAGILLLKEH